MMLVHSPLRVGIAGPVGAGKTTLTLALCRALRERYHLAVVTNDIYSADDARFLVEHEALAPERIIGVETGTCPHTAIREDAAVNLEAIERLGERLPTLEIVFIEAGGDSLAGSFSPELSDLTVYLIDAGAGERVVRKGGPAIGRCDLLVINKTDLAPLVGTDLAVMAGDAYALRGERPVVFTNLRKGEGLEAIIAFIETEGLLHAAAA